MTTEVQLTRETGIERIRDLMMRNEWPGTDSWAAQHRLNTATVRGWAAEASRILRMSVPDEVYLDELRGWLERLGAKAEESNDWRTAIKAIEVMLSVRDRDVKRFEVAQAQVARMSLERQVAVVLGDPILGPAVEHEVLRRRGLVVDG